VDNFVDIYPPATPKPCGTRLWLDCPSKEHRGNIYMNQQLAIAIGFVAKRNHG
jgi:hypothetical protein